MKITIFELKKIAYVTMLSTILANGIAFGQQISKDIPLQVFHYQIDNEKFFVIEGHVQGSQLSFYDKQGGGKIIKSITTMQGNSKYKLKTEDGFTPSFVLNNQNSRSCNIAGSGMVAHLTTQEFLLKKLAICRKADSYNELSWQASVANVDRYYFVIESTVDGDNYKLLTEIFPSSENISKYVYSDIPSNRNTTYRVSILKNDIGSRFSTTLSISDFKNELIVYPTLVHSQLNIKNFSNDGYTYEIQSIDGRVILKGSFNNHTSIDLQSISNGNYYILLHTESSRAPIKQYKFTKI